MGNFLRRAEDLNPGILLLIYIILFSPINVMMRRQLSYGSAGFDGRSTVFAV
jgi:hypothetical protein